MDTTSSMVFELFSNWIIRWSVSKQFFYYCVSLPAWINEQYRNGRQSSLHITTGFARYTFPSPCCGRARNKRTKYKNYVLWGQYSDPNQITNYIGLCYIIISYSYDRKILLFYVYFVVSQKLTLMPTSAVIGNPNLFILGLGGTGSFG